MDTNEEDIKQAATSVASTSTSIPSSMNPQQDFQKTTSTGTPSHYPEDHQHQAPPSSLEKEAVSPSNRAAGQSHSKKADASRSLEDEKLKKSATRSQRQKNRLSRILARAGTSTPIAKPNRTDTVAKTDDKLKVVGTRSDGQGRARTLSRRPSGG